MGDSRAKENDTMTCPKVESGMEEDEKKRRSILKIKLTEDDESISEQGKTKARRLGDGR